MTARQSGAATWGAFSLGDMALALPLSALREVLPTGTLVPLPTAQPCVAGALEVRGIHVPVIDLRVLLGRAGQAVAGAVVVLAVHESRLVGLVADAVRDVFDAPPAGLARVGGTGGEALLLAGSLRRPDGQGLVSVLQLAALAAWPGVPMVDDPEPGRTQVDDAAVPPTPPGGEVRPMMLVRCAGVGLAIEATRVHAAVPEPRLEPAPMAGGACLGTMAWTGLHIPAVDLLDLCGLGRQEPAAIRQALVLRYPAGYVALLIGSVVDVVRTEASSIAALPAFGLAQPRRFAGALSHGAGRPYLVLDAEALAEDDLLASLAATNVGTAGEAMAAAAAIDGTALLTFDLGGEVAVPVAQVREILSFRPPPQPLAPQQSLLDIVVERGCPIPVLCLAHVAGLAPAVLGADARVLVVESPAGAVGFAVAALRSIDAAQGERELPVPAAPDALTRALRTGRVAFLGGGTAQRTVPMLDLLGVAAALAPVPA